MAKFDIQAFFNNIEGKTWSLGSAFKRADALPLDLYSVWESKAEAETYASTHATAYPGQILVVVEKENEIDVIKLYYIDENRELQEVGSATLGDEKTIVLDPESKILSIKGFENAGFATAAGDKYNAEGKYFSLVDGKYIAKEDAPSIDSEGNIIDDNCYKRIGVKLIKDDTGALNWITDDAVEIQGEIGGLKTTVGEHTEAIEAIEEDIEAIDARITSLGTVFSFVGTLSTEEYSSTTNSDKTIDTTKNGVRLDRPYRLGDVILVGTQEYVVTQGEGTSLVWEAFGDPNDIEGVKNRVGVLEGTATTHSNALTTLNGDVNTEGSVAHTAKGYADAAVTAANGYTDTKVKEVKDIADANKDEIFGKAAQGEPGTEGYVPAVEGLKAKVEANATNISNLDKALNGDSTSTDDKIKAGIKGRVSTLENESAKATDLQALGGQVEALGNNLKDSYYTKTQIDDATEGYAKKSDLNTLSTTVNENKTASTNNKSAIDIINTKLTGAADGNGTEGLTGTVNGLVNTTSGHTTAIEGLTGRLDEITGTNGSIAKAQADASKALTDAANAQKDATQALKDAKAASDLAGEKATLDEVKGLNYATKTEAEGYAKAVQGDTSETVKSAYELAGAANSAADTAQDRADAAYELADGVKTDLANNYTNTTGMNAAIAAVVGKTAEGETDSKDDITVKGTRLYAKDLADGLDTKIADINTALVDLTTVMNFVGVFDALPTIKDAEGKDLYQVGDVCIVGDQEYVLVEVENVKDWEPFGTVTADAARFEAIEKVIGTRDTDGTLIPGAVGTLLKDVDDLQDLTATLKSTSDGYATRFTDAEDRIKVVEDTINDTTDAEGNTVKGLATRLTEVEGVASAAATQEALNKEISDRGIAEAALDKKITEGFAGQNTVNVELQANIDAIYKLNEDGTDSGLLTWGTF